jgi:hypothetical protein
LPGNPRWIFIGLLLFTIVITILSEGFGLGIVSTSFIKILGKTLCLCLIAIAMDLVWGYCGILSLGHFAFFGLGGYMIGMWLMYERTKDIVIASLSGGELPATPEEITEAIGTQIFGVVGGAEIPVVWYFADSLIAAVGAGGARAGAACAGVRLAGVPQPRDRRVSFDPDPGDDPGAVALPFPERLGPQRQQRPFGTAEHSRPDRSAAIGGLGLVFLGLGLCAGSGLSGGCLGGVGQVRQCDPRQSATTRRASASWAIPSRPTSWWCSR